MRRAAKDDEQAEQHGGETWPEALVVVACAAPAGEAVFEEVVVAITLRAAEDGGDNAEAGVAFVCAGYDLGACFLGGAFLDVDAGFGLLVTGVGSGLGGAEFSEEGRDGLVGVELLGAFAVLLVDFVEVRRGGDAEEGVEGCVEAFGGEDFVVEAKDFVVFFRPGVKQGTECEGNKEEQRWRPHDACCGGCCPNDQGNYAFQTRIQALTHVTTCLPVAARPTTDLVCVCLSRQILGCEVLGVSNVRKNLV